MKKRIIALLLLIICGNVSAHSVKTTLQQAEIITRLHSDGYSVQVCRRCGAGFVIGKDTIFVFSNYPGFPKYNALYAPGSATYYGGWPVETLPNVLIRLTEGEDPSALYDLWYYIVCHRKHKLFFLGARKEK